MTETAHQKGTTIEVVTREATDTLPARSLACIVAGPPDTCRTCGAEVLWVLTPKGKRLIVDLPDDDAIRTTSHWLTCPDAREWAGKTRGEMER